MKQLGIYKVLKDKDKSRLDWGEYVGFICVAESEEEALSYSPFLKYEKECATLQGYEFIPEKCIKKNYDWNEGDKLKCEYLGETTLPKGLLMAYYTGD